MGDTGNGKQINKENGRHGKWEIDSIGEKYRANQKLKNAIKKRITNNNDGIRITCSEHMTKLTMNVS